MPEAKHKKTEGSPPTAEHACRKMVDRGWAGPYLRYINILPEEGVWLGSVLLLVRSERLGASRTPAQPPAESADRPTRPGDTQSHDITAEMVMWEADGKEQGQSTSQGVLLTEVEGWQAWRFGISLSLHRSQRPIAYHVAVGPVQTEQCVFWIPGGGQPMHWGYTSCNGLSSDVPEDAPERQDATYLWRDLLQLHDAYPMHCLFGGGDQVYNDLVWSEPSLKEWGNLEDREAKLSANWTPEMEGEATEFYCRNYIDTFSTTHIATAMACIPQLMQWDDHDIWDGWGSYREDVQSCFVFKGLFQVARRFFLLFQKHTTVERVDKEGEFLNKGSYHSVHYLGPTVALFSVDMRTQRTRSVCVPEADYPLLLQAAQALPVTVEHLVMASGVPVVWPNIPSMELLLRGLEHAINRFNCLLDLTKKTGLVDQFDQPEILDDLHDGWIADLHSEERIRFIHLMQDMATSRQLRVSILSGDAHVAGIGRLYSHPKYKNLENDPLFMPQITSSAIVNAPPPNPVVRTLTRLNFSKKIDGKTKQKMVRAFWPRHPRVDKLLAYRNWCDVSLVAPPFSAPMVPGEADHGALRFVLRVERPKQRLGFAEETYTIAVPRFVPDKRSERLTGDTEATRQRALRALAAAGVALPAVFFSLNPSKQGSPQAEPVEEETEVNLEPSGGLNGRRAGPQYA
uniref:PhoD-like phosphatase domain-containing protein n=2 Tax=Auxenochlorella protothecoides TaxID=3075 RepID=A0A1D2A293_AUXPR